MDLVSIVALTARQRLLSRGLCFGYEAGSPFASGGRALDCLDHERMW